MNRRTSAQRTPMNHDAYAGFLKLLLTPTDRLPLEDRDVEEYIRHANRVDPLSRRTRRLIGHPADRAA